MIVYSLAGPAGGAVGLGEDVQIVRVNMGAPVGEDPLDFPPIVSDRSYLCLYFIFLLISLILVICSLLACSSLLTPSLRDFSELWLHEEGCF